MSKSLDEYAREAIAKGPVTEAESADAIRRVLEDHEAASARMMAVLDPLRAARETWRRHCEQAAVGVMFAPLAYKHSRVEYGLLALWLGRERVVGQMMLREMRGSR